MKRILIISDRNESLSELLISSHTETMQVTGSAFDDACVDSSTVVLAALDCCSSDELEYCLELARGRNGIICGFSDTLTAETRAKLLQYGIAMFSKRSDLIENPDLLKFLFARSGANGIAVLIDSDRSRSALGRSVFESFGYDICHLSSPEELYALKIDPSFILHNLSLKDIDLMSFVRKGSTTNLFRTVPYIAYKNGGEGVSLNEINAGIGRLTGYILSEEEVWSVVVFNLFRKELYSGTDHFLRAIKMSENNDIARESIRKLFFSKEMNFFTSPDRGVARALLSSGDKLFKISETLNKMHFFEWLVCDQPGQNLISTGV